MDHTDINQFLVKNVVFFKGFPEYLLKELIKGSKTSTFEPNEALIEFGEEGRFLGILVKGELEVSITDDSGEKHIIAILKPGEFFGEMSLMTGDKTTADVIGKTQGEALLIPQDLFSAILTAHPPAIKFFSKIISDRMKKLSYEEKGRELAKAALKKSEDPYSFGLKSGKPMKILVINCGSSLFKYVLYDTKEPSKNARGTIEKTAGSQMRHTYHTSKGEIVKELEGAGPREAVESMASELTSKKTGVIKSPDEITAIGHRVVHGGDKFNHPVIIGEQELKDIEKISHLAPFHNPINILGIKEAQKIFPKAPHVAVFDTAFHQTIPPYAYLYGLPYEYYENKKIRRYGFHGMSHSYVSLKAAEFLKRPYNELEIITCHLGNGASICAVDHGRSIDTSMGMTPAEGLIMGTRSGTIDPAIIIHLMRTEKLSPDDLDRLINNESGLKGLSGISTNMQEIEKEADKGNQRALITIKTFSYQVRKYIGAYIAAMGGIDSLVFTGKIGRGSSGVRSIACQGLGCMGIEIDEEKNRNAASSEKICEISPDTAQVKVLVIPADEELMIARETLKVINNRYVAKIIDSHKSTPIPIEVSAHHIHLSQKDFEALFGPGAKLTPEFELSQPGQYAANEKVTLTGPKGRIERVRILGPLRRDTQIEIAMTEQFILGIQPPIRESGDIKGSPGIIIEDPKGKIITENGVICALRHIHMTPEDALNFGLKDKDMVMVKVKGDRELVFGDILIRVNPNFKLAMHIDTDEANAANLKTGSTGYIEAIQERK